MRLRTGGTVLLIILFVIGLTIAGVGSAAAKRPDHAGNGHGPSAAEHEGGPGNEDINEKNERADSTLDLALVAGTPAPNASITMQLTDNGTAVAGVNVTSDDEIVGTTDAGGNVTVTIPATATEVEYEAEHDGDEAELEFEFEDDDDEADEVEPELDLALVSGTPAPNATVTLQLTDNGSAVANATVTLNDERIGATDASGNVTAAIPSDVTKAKFKAEYLGEDAELEFEFEDEEAKEEDQ